MTSMSYSERLRIEREVKAALEIKRRGLKPFRSTKLGLSDWLTTYQPKSTWDYPWHKVVIPKLEQLLDGGRRLAISLPPRSGKSFLSSQRFPVYFLDRRPRANVILTSYSALLSTRFSRVAREIARGRGMLGSKQSSYEWNTILGGELFSAGITGSLTGRGADLLIADDLVASIEETTSLRQLDKIWESFSADFMTRGDPGFSALVVSTRWSVEDVIGRLMRQESSKWEFMNIKAICDDEATDPLGRKLGDVLNPKRQSLEQLMELRDLLTPRIFNALFQGEPVVAEGERFKVDNIKFVDSPPFPLDQISIYFDTSGGKGAAYTVGALLGRKGKEYYLIMIDRFKLGSNARLQRMIEKAKNWLADYKEASLPPLVGVEVQGGSAGVEVAEWERQNFASAGINLVMDRPIGSKEERAVPLEAIVEAGQFSLVRSSWNRAFLEEMTLFPFGPTKDQIDAVSAAFAKLYRKVTSEIF